MFQLIEHTTDIRMNVRGATLAELFSEALRGLMAIVEPEGVPGETVRLEIELESGDRTWLLVDFLNEALTRAHLRKEIYTAVDFGRLTETHLEASLSGFRVAGFAEDVKAVTYHDAEVRESDGQWSTTLVFDI